MTKIDRRKEEMKKEEVLKQLSLRYRENKHIIIESVEDNIYFQDIEKWVEAGKPYIWLVAARKHDVTLLQDVSRGYLAIIVNDKVESCGKDYVQTQDEEFAGLSPVYTGTDEARLYQAI